MTFVGARPISRHDTLRHRLATLLDVEAADDKETLQKYSRDSSIFERTPKLVVYPKHAEDVSAVVHYVHEARSHGDDISVTARAAGTDMSGGPLTDSIKLVFTKYMNRIGEIKGDVAEVEPGVYYRDFEKATLAQGGLILPSFPASREVCALGGMINNNSGGDLALKYGKTDRYIRELDVVLSDGSRATLRPLSKNELEQKKSSQTLEGAIYRGIHQLILDNADEIERARPVTKNSAGYALWNVHDKTLGTFDLTQLIAGAQGTLAFVTKAKMGLVRKNEHCSMLVIFLSDLEILPVVVNRVLKFDPESLESYDDQTFKLAVRSIPQMINDFGIMQNVKLGTALLTEMVTAIGGAPKLTLIAEFSDDTPHDAIFRAESAQKSLFGLPVRTSIARSETQATKHWSMRRESFALLRKNLRGPHASPFIDDIVVHPDEYPKFLPELSKLLNNYSLDYSITGHAGDGNFHIIPLMDLKKPGSRKAILELQPKVFELVTKYRGSITGQHNDGIIRTPYLNIMFGEKMCDIFAQVKRIFDPLNILNPGKKVGGTIADIEKSMLK